MQYAPFMEIVIRFTDSVHAVGTLGYRSGMSIACG